MALLDALNGSSSAAADSGGTESAPIVQFRTSTGKGGGGSGGGVYFAEQPSSAWQQCDTGMDVHTRATYLSKTDLLYFALFVHQTHRVCWKKTILPFSLDACCSAWRAPKLVC